MTDSRLKNSATGGQPVRDCVRKFYGQTAQQRLQLYILIEIYIYIYIKFVKTLSEGLRVRA